MTRITNSDQVLSLIRAELQKMERSRGARRRTGASGTKETPGSPLERLFSSPAFHSLSEEERHRAFIRGIMTEAFGAGLANDARFIAIAGDVYEAISASPDGTGLIRSALARLGS